MHAGSFNHVSLFKDVCFNMLLSHHLWSLRDITVRPLRAPFLLSVFSYIVMNKLFMTKPNVIQPNSYCNI